MNKIIIANWKMNPVNLEEALELFKFSVAEASKHQNLKVVICPPFVYLEELARQVPAVNRQSSSISLGGQDLFWEKSGPYTGEVSIDMLKNFGVTHVLVGHSDRRYKIGETDEVINKKIGAALGAGVTPVLLVGERNRGDDRKQVLETQLTADLAGLTADQVGKVLITYEPVWAISTTPGAEPDTPENTLEAIKIIQELLGFGLAYSAEVASAAKAGQVSGFRFLYGGSINKKNVADFLKYPEIFGAVIGGASLRKKEFGDVLKIVSSL
ncbi:MAG: triosephosphate isomerase [Candidatus Yanofskybacteria bacterium]|nr:triosephosphate isomerase [Candidatus Yanofskybacteria bacterium]